MEILDSLTTPQDIKNMSIGDLYKLCEDLRYFILSNISKTGGHLASNLGVVEITVAIHNVFDTSRDRVVFDVGHQCYVHKILTGRKDKFGTIRSLNGISGFPSPSESEHDAFMTGHASTSVSAALGMARARTALNEDYSVIALIGDGALTGGLSYEGLSDAGHSGEPLIVILNDNEMSITKNVGGLSNHLAHLRTRPYYLSVKKVYRKTIAKIPYLGLGVTKILRRIKSGIKESMRLPSSVFEGMGFKYLGPVDGHNIKEMCRLLKVAREIAKPVIIHARTTKGKGYEYAEQHPEIYHGVSSFNIRNGEYVESGNGTFATSFGKAIVGLAGDDKRICAITAAMQAGTGLDEMAERCSEQFFDVGIAEGHAVTMAGAMAKQGLLPVCAIYSTFIQRAYDMLFHDVCLQNLHVVFAIDRAGLVPDDGQTHQGIFDIGIFLQMPNMTVLCPVCVSEIKEMLRYALYDLKGAAAIRYPRGGCQCKHNGNDEISTCKNYGIETKPPYKPVLIKPGKDAAIVTYGRLLCNTIEAADILEKAGIDIAVIRITELTGVSINNLISLTPGTETFFMVEECVQAGSVASKLALETTKTPVIVPLNIGNEIPPPGTAAELMSMYGLDAHGISETVKRYCSN